MMRKTYLPLLLFLLLGSVLAAQEEPETLLLTGARVLNVDGDPLVDVSVLRRPLVVWKQGRVIVDRR